MSKTFWNRIIRSCRRSNSKNIDLSITREEAYQLLLTQNKLCALTGVPLILGKYKNGILTETTASLDRINSDLGYVKGNVQWVHKTINLMKNKLPQEEFLLWCELVVKHKI